MFFFLWFFFSVIALAIFVSYFQHNMYAKARSTALIDTMKLLFSWMRVVITDHCALFLGIETWPIGNVFPQNMFKTTYWLLLITRFVKIIWCQSTPEPSCSYSMCCVCSVLLTFASFLPFVQCDFSVFSSSLIDENFAHLRIAHTRLLTWIHSAGRFLRKYLLRWAHHHIVKWANTLNRNTEKWIRRRNSYRRNIYTELGSKWKETKRRKYFVDFWSSQNCVGKEQRNEQWWEIWAFSLLFLNVINGNK